MAGSMIGAGLQSAFGSDYDIEGAIPNFSGFTTPAFSTIAHDDGSFEVRLNKDFENSLKEFQRLAGARGDEISDLLPLVAPGMGALTKSRLEKVRGAKEEAMGGATKALQRRNVLGSSFGQTALADIERLFGREEAEVTAQSFLEELELTNNLMRERTQTLQEGISFDANARLGVSQIGSQAITSMMNIMSSNGQFLADLRAQQAVAEGQFFGQIGSGIWNLASAGFNAAGGFPAIFGSGAGAGTSASTILSGGRFGNPGSVFGRNMTIPSVI